MERDHVYRRHHSYVQDTLQFLQRTTRLRPVELVVVALYPLTIILGQVMYFISEIQPNYYTSKHNLVNVLFVKQGWFWTLLAVTSYLVQFRHRIRNPFVVLTRILIFTLWWILFTQWFFGLPIMDRVFVASGGSCNFKDDVTREGDASGYGSLACRKDKGKWVGGHDPSGHVFLLVHGSLLLWFEILETGFIKEAVDLWQRLKSCHNWREAAAIIMRNSVVVVAGILAIWWWMLLVTSIHFHTVAEKLSGLLFGLVGIAVYVIPRFYNWM